MARGIVLDWVVVRIITIRKVATVGITVVLAAFLLAVLHYRMNPTPDVAAKRSLVRAERARGRALAEELPEAWRGEFNQATHQLESARTAYTDEDFPQALEMADSARLRFDALAGVGRNNMIGAGQFHGVRGRVTIQRAGRSSWDQAELQMPVFNNDFVKTGRDGSAEILFVDGTLFRVTSNSLLEIHQTDSVARDSAAAKMVVGRINVITGRSRSVVATDSVETQIERDSRIAVDVPEDHNKTVVSAFAGGATLESSSGSTLRVSNREQVEASGEGEFSTKRRIPRAPVPLEPMNNAGFDLRTDGIIPLRWSKIRGTSGARLQVSRNKSFQDGAMDVDSDVIKGTRARLQAIHPGTFFWRLASVSDNGLISEWSTVQRFRIYSPDHPRVIRDLDPPDLRLVPIRQLGHLFIVEGQTEAGATITINDETVETDLHGHFQRTVEVRSFGWNDLIIRSTDPSGNHTERHERVYLEDF